MRARVEIASMLAIVAAAMACGPGRPPAPAPASARPPEVAPRRAAPRRVCPGAVDARDLLARHANGFGSPEAVAAELPRSFGGSAAVEKQSGRFDVTLTATELRSTTIVAGLFEGDGIDAEGAWKMPAGSGVLERVDGAPERFDAWRLRRTYVTAFDPARDTASCVDAEGGARVDVRFADDAIGAPTLSFDLESASLLAFSRRDGDGRRTRTTIEAWSAPDERGVRWPKKETTHPATGSATEAVYERSAPGLSCAHMASGGVAVPESGPACARPPADVVTVRWPASGRVRVPLRFSRRSLFVKAKLGDREVDALLDSGASVTMVDALSPAGRSFRPTLDLQGASATQKIRVGFGVLPEVVFGDLVLSNLPSASVPVPAFEAFGKGRPEVVLGYTFFSIGVVRIDYAKGEIVIAKPGTALASKHARAPIPLTAPGAKLLLPAEVEGHRALFELDTGSTGGLDPYAKWEDSVGLPGHRPSVVVKGRFSAGTAETASRFFRLGTAEVGGIRLDGMLVHDGAPPDPGAIAGLVGNSVFARCDAIVIDRARATLVLDGTCDRALAENKMLWRFAKKPDAAYPDRPWVVDLIVPGSSVELAGIQKGDRVLEVDGRGVSEDLAALEAIETRSEGTKVPVVIVRDGVKKRVVVVLARLLADGTKAR